MTYNRLHMLAFTFMGFVGAIVLYIVEEGQAPFIDTLFMAFSSVCVTGLSVLDTASLRLGSQIVIALLIFLGGNILWSTVPVLIRRHYFAKTMKHELRSLGINEKECSRLLNEEVEYRALGWVLRIAYAHLLFWPLAVAISWGLYFTLVASMNAIFAKTGVNVWWFSFFLSYSSLNNAGLLLLSENMMPFIGNHFVLLSASWLILLGNVAYPIIMYLSVYLLHCVYGAKEPAFAFLLARPRKCFTHLFNRYSTMILATVVIGTTFFEFFLFLALDFNEEYMQTFPAPVRALAGWFQAVSTRTAGYNVVDLAQLAPAMQLVYAVMMYMTAYPFALTVRKSADMDAAAAAAGIAELGPAGWAGGSAGEPDAEAGGESAGAGSTADAPGKAPAQASINAAVAAAALASARLPASGAASERRPSFSQLAAAIAAAQARSGLGAGGSVSRLAMPSVGVGGGPQTSTRTARDAFGLSARRLPGVDSPSTAKAKGSALPARTLATDTPAGSSPAPLRSPAVKSYLTTLAESRVSGAAGQPSRTDAASGAGDSSARAFTAVVTLGFTDGSSQQVASAERAAPAGVELVPLFGPSAVAAGAPTQGSGEGRSKAGPSTAFSDTPSDQNPPLSSGASLTVVPEASPPPAAAPQHEHEHAIADTVPSGSCGQYHRRGSDGGGAGSAPARKSHASYPRMPVWRAADSYLDHELGAERPAPPPRPHVRGSRHTGRVPTVEREQSDGPHASGTASEQHQPPAEHHPVSALDVVLGLPYVENAHRAAAPRQRQQREHRRHRGSALHTHDERHDDHPDGGHSGAPSDAEDEASKRQGHSHGRGAHQHAHGTQTAPAVQFHAGADRRAGGGDGGAGRQRSASPGWERRHHHHADARWGDAGHHREKHHRQQQPHHDTDPARGNDDDDGSSVGEHGGSTVLSTLYDDNGKPLPPPPGQTLRKEASSMFSRELFWLFMALLVITISESNNIRDCPNPTYFNIFTVLFELSSAFGTVGLTIGYPNSVLALSAQFNTFSKLVVIAVMLAGRHRGLPTAIDPAVYLPALLSTNAATGPSEEGAPPAVPPDAVGALVQMSVRIFDAAARRSESLRTLFPQQQVAAGGKAVGQQAATGASPVPSRRAGAVSPATALSPRRSGVGHGSRDSFAGVDAVVRPQLSSPATKPVLTLASHKSLEPPSTPGPLEGQTSSSASAGLVPAPVMTPTALHTPVRDGAAAVALAIPPASPRVPPLRTPASPRVPPLRMNELLSAPT